MDGIGVVNIYIYIILAMMESCCVQAKFGEKIKT